MVISENYISQTCFEIIIVIFLQITICYGIPVITRLVKRQRQVEGSYYTVDCLNLGYLTLLNIVNKGYIWLNYTCQ